MARFDSDVHRCSFSKEEWAQILAPISAKMVISLLGVFVANGCFIKHLTKRSKENTDHNFQVFVCMEF